DQGSARVLDADALSQLAPETRMALGATKPVVDAISIDEFRTVVNEMTGESAPGDAFRFHGGTGEAANRNFGRGFAHLVNVFAALFKQLLGVNRLIPAEGVRKTARGVPAEAESHLAQSSEEVPNPPASSAESPKEIAARVRISARDISDSVRSGQRSLRVGDV